MLPDAQHAHLLARHPQRQDQRVLDPQPEHHLAVRLARVEAFGRAGDGHAPATQGAIAPQAGLQKLLALLARSGDALQAAAALGQEEDKSMPRLGKVRSLADHGLQLGSRVQACRRGAGVGCLVLADAPAGVVQQLCSIEDRSGVAGSLGGQVGVLRVEGSRLQGGPFQQPQGPFPCDEGHAQPRSDLLLAGHFLPGRVEARIIHQRRPATVQRGAGIAYLARGEGEAL